MRARMLAIADLVEGETRRATARRFGMSRNVLWIWVSRYNAGGPEALVDDHGGGPSPLLTLEQRTALKAMVLEGAPVGGDEAYRVADIRALVEREFGVRYSLSGMRRLLNELGLSRPARRPRTGVRRERRANPKDH